MKKIIGKFTRSDYGKPAANCVLTLQLSNDARTIIATGEELEWPEAYERRTIQLDANGEIPAGVTILANDEIVEESTYEVRVFEPAWEGADKGTVHFCETLTLAGPESIDFNTLHPKLYPKPAPLPPPPPPRLTPLRTKASGFFGGIVHPPTKAVSTTVFYNPFNNGPYVTDAGLFGVAAFTLPRRTVVNSVSIFINTPSPVPGEMTVVVVGLYELQSRKKLFDVAIDASSHGKASGVLGAPVTLPAADYVYAWGTNRPCNTLEVCGLSGLSEYDSTAFDLVDSRDGEIASGTAKGRVGKLLPETLGVIDASREGVAIGKFPGATLNSGDHLLTWRTAFPSRTLKVRSAVPVYAAQLALARGMQPILAHFG